MRILVTRGAGDKLAPETLIDVLCITTGIGTERGKVFLYDEGYNRRMYEIIIPYTSKIYPSDLVAIHDNSLGESFVARVVSHTVKIKMENEVLSIESVIRCWERKKLHC
ncbi:MAG: hypothetical protein B7C24_16595 [Bacteroidetes bacterium 4572_77]|nr:MAG: hypothetical protein B7C24_16595 [Bacteroidetes bacterium 4572_77]